LKKLNNIWWI